MGVEDKRMSKLFSSEGCRNTSLRFHHWVPLSRASSRNCNYTILLRCVTHIDIDTNEFLADIYQTIVPLSWDPSHVRPYQVSVPRAGEICSIEAMSERIFWVWTRGNFIAIEAENLIMTCPARFTRLMSTKAAAKVRIFRCLCSIAISNQPFLQVR